MRALRQPPFAFAAFVLALQAPPASAQEPAGEPVQAAPGEPMLTHVELSAEALSETGRDEVALEVEEQFAALAREHDLVEAEPEAAALVVTLDIGQPDKKADVHVIHASARYEGELLSETQTHTCVRCTAAELVNNGLEVIPPALAELAERRAAKEASEAKATPAPQLPGPEDSARRITLQVLGPVGYVGVASSVLGLGSAIAGTVFLARGKVVQDADDFALTVETVDYRPTGKALIGAGLGLLVAGNVLLAVDLAMLAPRRRSKAPVRIERVALTGLEGPGLVIGGRF